MKISTMEEDKPQEDPKPTRHEMREQKRTAKEAARQEQIKHASRAKMKKRVLTLSVVVLIIVGIGYVMITLGPQIKGVPSGVGPVGSTHEHVDFKVYLSGSAIDLSQAKYQVRARHVHVENGVGDVVHTHATGVTWPYFFDTLGMKLNSTCFVDDAARAFCNNPATNQTLKFYLNGRLSNEQIESYVLRDLDKVLISYGNETEAQIQAQLKSVTNLACIESRKPCPSG